MSTALAPTQSPSRPLSQPWITRPAPSWKSNVLPRPRDESNCLPGVPAALSLSMVPCCAGDCEWRAAAAYVSNAQMRCGIAVSVLSLSPRGCDVVACAAPCNAWIRARPS